LCVPCPRSTIRRRRSRVRRRPARTGRSDSDGVSYAGCVPQERGKNCMCTFHKCMCPVAEKGGGGVSGVGQHEQVDLIRNMSTQVDLIREHVNSVQFGNMSIQLTCSHSGTCQFSSGGGVSGVSQPEQVDLCPSAPSAHNAAIPLALEHRYRCSRLGHYVCASHQSGVRQHE